jgi:hypothetical protein
MLHVLIISNKVILSLLRLSNKILVKKYFQSKKIKDSYENVNCILVYGGL